MRRFFSFSFYAEYPNMISVTFILTALLDVQCTNTKIMCARSYKSRRPKQPLLNKKHATMNGDDGKNSQQRAPILSTCTSTHTSRCYLQTPPPPAGFWYTTS